MISQEMYSIGLSYKKCCSYIVYVTFLDAVEVDRESDGEGNIMTSMDLPVQSQQWKLQNNRWNLFQINNEDNRTTLVTSFWFLYC